MATKLLSWILIIIPIILGLSFIVLEIYVWIKYGNMPYGETPNWVQWLMGGRK